MDIRDLAVDDVDELVSCVKRCYGDTYADDDFYEPDVLRAAVQSGRLVSKVAVTAGGRVVAHLGSRLPVPGDRVAETVGGFVDPEHRGQNLLRTLGAKLVRGYRRLGLRGIRHTATGSHLQTQRQISGAGGVVTGALLGHIPAATEYRAMEATGGKLRIGAFVFYHPIEPLPALEVDVPDRLWPAVSRVYDAAGLVRRRVSPPAGEPPRYRATRLRRRDAWVLAFDPDGEVLDEVLAPHPVVYVDVPIARPGAGGALGEALARGFAYGALYPGSESSELLRLQRVELAECDPDRTLCIPEAEEWLRTARAEQRPARAR